MASVQDVADAIGRLLGKDQREARGVLANLHVAGLVPRGDEPATAEDAAWLLLGLLIPPHQGDIGDGVRYFGGMTFAEAVWREVLQDGSLDGYVMGPAQVAAGPDVAPETFTETFAELLARTFAVGGASGPHPLLNVGVGDDGWAQSAFVTFQINDNGRTKLNVMRGVYKDPNGSGMVFAQSDLPVGRLAVVDAEVFPLVGRLLSESARTSLPSVSTVSTEIH